MAMHLHQNGNVFCKITSRLPGSDEAVRLPKHLEPAKVVRVVFLQAAKEPPLDQKTNYTLVEGKKVIPIQIIDINQLGGKIWLKCYVPEGGANVNPPVAAPKPRAVT